MHEDDSTIMCKDHAGHVKFVISQIISRLMEVATSDEGVHVVGVAVAEAGHPVAEFDDRASACLVGDGPRVVRGRWRRSVPN